MAGLQIGRLFADYTVQPQQVMWQGRRLSLAGLVDIGSVDQAKAVREQIIGMNSNPDEPFVALQWDADPTVDGFYRVLGLATDPGLMHLVTGYLTWSAELERVTDSQFAPLESHVTWQVATNTHGITSVSFGTTDVLQWAVPGSAYEFGPVSGTVSGGGTSSTTVSTPLATGFGSLKFVTDVEIPSTGIMGWSCPPTDYYHGNCRVVMDVGTATDQLVLGRRATDSYDWEVSNGLVRFWVDSADDSLRVEHWQFTSSQWRRPNSTNYEFLFGSGAPVTYHSMTILRNSPECVAIRLGCNNGSLAWQNRIYVDLMILRGSQTVYGYISTPPEISNWDTKNNLGVGTTANVASSTVTGGITATSADANGMRYIILTGTPACTNTLASGFTLTTSTVNSLTFGLNASGAGPSGTNLEFFARRSEVTRVVAR